MSGVIAYEENWDEDQGGDASNIPVYSQTFVESSRAARYDGGQQYQGRNNWEDRRGGGRGDRRGGYRGGRGRGNWEGGSGSDRGGYNDGGSGYNRGYNNSGKYNNEGGGSYNENSNRGRSNWEGGTNRSHNDGGGGYNRDNFNRRGGRGNFSSRDGGRGGWNSQESSDERSEGSNNRGGWSGRSENRGNWRERSDNQEEKNGISITVNTSNVGKIIGRGGTKIRELQSESGARIQVNKPSNEDFGLTSVIDITGSEEEQNKAKELIEELIESMSQVSFTSSSNASNEENNEPTKAPINWSEVNKIYEEAQKERWSKCPPMIKDFYVEDPEVAKLSKEEVNQFRKVHMNITVSHFLSENDDDIPNPVITFEQCFSQYPQILEEIHKQGFKEPSPIQCQAWPVLLKGHDLIGIAQTGTGKTLAFLLPALIHIDNQPVPRNERGGSNVLILAPTRELALQIEKEIRKYNYKDIKCVCVYGGGNRREQMNVVNKGVEIIVATPGRLNDLVQAGVIDVTSITYLVLDEADRMLDMGFEPQIRKTLLDIRPDRQTVMTSATWPEGVRRLAQSYMNDPVQVWVGSLDLAAVHTVTQHIDFVTEDEKTEKLYQFIYGMQPDDKVIVFVGKKTRADDISSELGLNGVVCQSIHGARDQADREQALEDLKTGDVRILIATDVASRGIDIEDVTHIFNFDFPRNVEEYVHRVGRTGRAGKTGEAISLVTREDWGQAKELIAILEEAEQEVPEELVKMSERFEAYQQRRNAEKDRERVDRRGGSRRGGGGYGGNFGGNFGGGFGNGRGRRDRY